MNKAERKQIYHDAAIALEVAKIKFSDFCREHKLTGAAVWGPFPWATPKSAKFRKAWREFMRDVAMPQNRKARDLILKVLDPSKPPTQPVREFFVYMAAWDELIDRWGRGVSLDQMHIDANFPSFLGMHLEALGRGEYDEG